MNLDRPDRFRVVCPALRPTPQGLRCHLDRENVRPFWGRSIGIYGALAFVGYLTIATMWFTLLRQQGMSHVAWLDCVLPLRHENISQARAHHFKGIAAVAIESKDMPLAIQSLSSSLASAPADWRNGLVLARLYEYTARFAEAESLYSRLLIQFPRHRDSILIAHHDSMLASQRLGSLLRLAETQLRANPGDGNPWLIPWLLLQSANQSKPLDDVPLTLNWSEMPLVYVLFQFVTSTDSPPPAKLIHDVATTPTQSPLAARIRWELLWRSGNRELARKALIQDAILLGPFEQKLGLAITIDPRVQEINYLNFWRGFFAGTELGPNQVERIVAVSLTSTRPLPLSDLRIRIPDSDRSSLSALWVLSLYQQDSSLRQSIESLLEISQESSLTKLSSKNLATNLFLATSVLPIPREVLYAITLAASSH